MKELTALNDGGSKLQNIGQYQPDYTQDILEDSHVQTVPYLLFNSEIYHIAVSVFVDILALKFVVLGKISI